MTGWARLVASVAAGILLATPASAEGIEDRIKRDGMLHCAAVERPGYAEIEDDTPMGRAAELCRTVAEAVLGRNGRFALRLLDLDSDFERVRDAEVELAFLEPPRTLAEHRLGAALVPLGEAYRDRFAVMLPDDAAAQSLADLDGQTVCFMVGDPVWPLLAGNFADRKAAFRPFGFSEEVEMKDAYNVGRCDAMAGLASTLDAARADGGVKHLHSRILPGSLGADPVEAMVPAGDRAWADTVRTTLAASPQPPR